MGPALDAVETDEMERAAYRINDTDRCFHCKAELMDVVAPIAAAERARSCSASTSTTSATPITGPGSGPRRGGASFPLVAAGFTKADVRQASRRLGLRTWDKPAAACLASRVPYGTEVTVTVLSRVERAEAALHDLGFAQVRVRHYGDTARIEVELVDLASPRSPVATPWSAGVRAAGYRYVTLDLEGFRSGNLNG